MPATMTSAVSMEWPASPPQGVSPATFICFISCSFLAHLRDLQDEEAADQQPDEEHGEYDRLPARHAEQLRPGPALHPTTPAHACTGTQASDRRAGDPPPQSRPGPPR